MPKPEAEFSPLAMTRSIWRCATMSASRSWTLGRGKLGREPLNKVGATSQPLGFPAPFASRAGRSSSANPPRGQAVHTDRLSAAPQRFVTVQTAFASAPASKYRSTVILTAGAKQRPTRRAAGAAKALSGPLGARLGSKIVAIASQAFIRSEEADHWRSVPPLRQTGSRRSSLSFLRITGFGIFTEERHRATLSELPKPCCRPKLNQKLRLDAKFAVFWNRRKSASGWSPMALAGTLPARSAAI